MDRSYAAIDLGAASGRVMRVAISAQRITLDEVARFVNEPVMQEGGLRWDVHALHEHVAEGLRELLSNDVSVRSLGVDTWGADYGLLRDGRLIDLPFSYRDARTDQAMSVVHGAIGEQALFAQNGLTPLPFNTVYQLVADQHAGRLQKADSMLFMPDVMAFLLTGSTATDVTISSTSGLLDLQSKTWNLSLLERLGLPSSVFPPIRAVGETVGHFPRDGAGGTRRVPVKLVAGHDTASAVVGTPLHQTGVYISCGTWALTGIELDQPVVSEKARVAGFTNERGADGRYRFQTNVMGLGILNEVLRDPAGGAPISIERAITMAAGVSLPESMVFDVADPVFLRQGDKRSEIAKWFSDRGLQPPVGLAMLFRTVIESLAESFASTIRALAEISGAVPTTIHLVGGGARNSLLCQRTADRTGLPVVAGPVEAAAVGNALLQFASDTGSHESLDSLRSRVADSLRRSTFLPTASETV